MTISKDLMLSILAMDSYNRGYGEGITGLGGLGSQVGAATISTDSETVSATKDDAQDAGFYAVSYTIGAGVDELNNGSTVISYRGTNSDGFWNFFTDAINGYGTAVGDSGNDQSHLAAEFFQSVTETTDTDPRTVEDVTLTGHSLGGGLAGLIGAMYHQDAVLFDNMPFEDAAWDAYFNAEGWTVSPIDLIQKLIWENYYNELTPWVPNIDNNIYGYAVTGEFLTALRSGQTANVSNLDSFGGLRSPVTLHSQALLVQLKFAQDNTHTDWTGVAGSLWDAGFSEEIGLAAGFDPAGTNGFYSASDKMMSAIAYSALDDGGLVFGSTGIRAMFNDANDLGKLVNDGIVPSTLEDSIPGITQAIVQFAGQMALREIRYQNHSDVNPEEGFLSVNEDASVLTLDLAKELWNLGADDPEAAFTVEGVSTLLDSFFSENPATGQGPTPADLNDVLAAMQLLYGASDTSVIDRIDYALGSGNLDVTLDERTSDPFVYSEDTAGVFAAGDGDDRVVGNRENNIIVGGKGDDHLNGQSGKNALFGGIGSDTLEVTDGKKNYLNGGDDDLITNLLDEDIAKFSSGVTIDDDGNEIATKQGIMLDGIKKTAVGDADALEITRKDLTTGNDSTDTLVNIETIELTFNPDRFEVTDDALKADIKVDLGDSRRLQSEIDRLNATLGEDEEPYVLEDDAFQQNVDIVDYSNLATGIKFATGKTADHQSGLLTGGITQSNTDLVSELSLLAGVSDDQHGLVTENAEKFILTDKDDVLISAEVGSIVDLGEGADKVWFQQGLLIQNFDLDDRLTLFGTVNVYGASRNVTSESQWAYGNFGMRYAINTEGDMVVSNLYAGYLYGASNMFIENWESTIGGYDSGIEGHGAGDIILQEVSFETKRLFEVRPEDDITSTWDYFVTKVRQLGGSPEKRDTVADPLVLDLDGDGIELVAQTSSSGRFDTDYDGYNERTAFADVDDGMLARDINGNGVIDDGSELFGYDDVYGFDILKTLDGNSDGVVNADDNGLVDFNGDGVIDSNDEFSDLLVWQDINGNRVSEDFELKSVTEHDITAINLPDAEGDVQFDENGNPTFINSVDGNEIIGRTTFERADGTTSELAEVLLKLDNIDTVYNGEEIIVSAEADALPDLSGQGTLVDLRKALSFVADPDDASDVQGVADRVLIVEDAIPTFTSPDVYDLAQNVRAVAHAWALASPIRNDDGEIVNELEFYGNLSAFRNSDGDIVDYIWGGSQEQGIDANDGSETIVTTLNFVSGSKLTHVYKVGSAVPSAIGSWEDLRDLYTGASSYELVKAGETDPNGGPVGEDDLVGVDGGLIYWTSRNTNTATVTRDEAGLSDNLLIETNSTLDLVDGRDVSFIARYLGVDLDAFYQEPKSADGLETLQILIDTFDSTFKKLGVQFAVQDGPLSHHFENIEFDVDLDKFVSTDEERELGGVFESLVEEGAQQGNPIAWLSEWSDFLDHFIGGYARQGDVSLNSNPFITQQFVNGFETANTGLDFMEVAGALGLRTDIIISGDASVDGTGNRDIFYVNGDETEINSLAGDDAIIFGQTINDVTINDTKTIGSNGFNQLRFAFHQADEFELSRDNLNLYVKEIATGKIITITKQFLGETPSLFGGNVAEQWGISQIVFADGTVWDEPQIVIEAANHDAGDSTEYGTNDNDYFDSGTGDDILIGGSDADIYYFEVGDGNDTISDSDSNPNKPFQDSIYFGSDLIASDIEFVREGNSNDLVIHYGDQGDTITIQNQFGKIHTGVFGSYFTDSIEYLHFKDGSAYTEDTILSTILRESSTDSDDTIYGFDNDDTFVNGLGNDYFIGSNGNDTYVYNLGDGHDVIEDNETNILSGRDDELIFGEGLELDDLVTSRTDSLNDIVLSFNGIEGSVLLQNQYSRIPAGLTDLWNDRVETIQFADGQELTWSELAQYHLDNAHTDGDDTINGFATDDTLYGGAGNDILNGDEGADTYLFGIGDGHDEINERVDRVLTSDFDTLKFIGDLTLPEVTFKPGDNSQDLVIEIIATGETLTINNQFWVANNLGHTNNDIEEFIWSDVTLDKSEVLALFNESKTTSGDDHIFGTALADTLHGGAGDDILEGGGFTDTYLFGYGDGHDIIRESIDHVLLSDFDKVIFDLDVTLDDVRLSLSENRLDLTVTLLSTGDTLTIENQFNLANTLGHTWNDVEQFVFAEATMDIGDILVRLLEDQATDGDDIIYGTTFHDTLDGGAGDDILEGGLGADTYVYGYGSGHDIIREDANYAFISSYDVVEFSGDIKLADVSFSVGANPNDLVITLNNSGETLTIEGQHSLSRNNSFYDIEEFRFADVTISQSEALEYMLAAQATDGDDVIYGTDTDNTFNGGLGNDVFHGNGAADTYRYARGDGNDLVHDTSNSNNIIFKDISLSDLEFTEVGSDLRITILPSSTDAADGGEILWLDALAHTSQPIIESMEFETSGEVLYWSQLMTLLFSSEISPDADIVNGTDSDDNILGDDSDSIVNSSNGNDTIEGAGGNDYLTGGLGLDTYIYRRGDGDDTIDETTSRFNSEADTLKLFGISSSEVSFLRDGNTLTLIIPESAPGAGDAGTIEMLETAQNGSRGGIKNIIFEDELDVDGNPLTWDRIQILDAVISEQQTAGDDVIVGFTNDDTFEGGSGDDQLTGGLGLDTYIYRRGDGDDTIDETTSRFNSDADTLKLFGISSSEVSFLRDGNTLTLVVPESAPGAGDAGSIEMLETAQNGSRGGIKNIIFEDELDVEGNPLAWDRSQILDAAISEQQTTGNDVIEGFSNDDTFEGGEGNDELIGATGLDTYIYRRGDGDDVIDEVNSRWNSDSDTLKLFGISSSDVSFTRDGTTLTLVVAESASGAGDAGSVEMLHTGQSYSRSTQGGGIKFITFEDELDSEGNPLVWDRSRMLDEFVKSQQSAGDDIIVGFTNDDTFEGGAGNDHITGSHGLDTYIYRRGDGNDVIDEVNSRWNSDSDTLKLFGISSSDVSFARDGTTLTLVISESAPGADDAGSIEMLHTGQSYSRSTQGGGIKFVTFEDELDSDGNPLVWDRSKILDEFVKSQQSAGDDVIVGFANDDTFEGGAGNDHITGSHGLDTYIYRRGDGNDVIDEVNSRWNSDSDTLILFGISSSDVSFTRDGTTLTLFISESAPGAGDAGSVEMLNTAQTYSQSTRGGGIKFIVFEDEIDGDGNPLTWDRPQILEIAESNFAPQIIDDIEDLKFDMNEAFSFALQTSAFSDPNSDELTFDVTLSNGDPLPSWLAFDSEQNVISGTPPLDYSNVIELMVTASDGELLATDSFTISIEDLNSAPIVTQPVDDQTVSEDGSFNFILPSDLFDDSDGDELIISAQLANGSPLPSWLAFDPVSRSFSGQYDGDFTSSIEIEITASDGRSSVSETFNLDIIPPNRAPVLENALSDQTSDEDTAVSFVLPADAFSDADGDTLTLTASLSDDSALPAWLSFDADTRTFAGTPPQDFNGALNIKVTASDGELEASDTFTLDISSVNDAPILNNALADQSSDEDTAVSFVLPADAFSDADGDTLTLTASLSDDSALPAWLSFDADTRTFAGTPPQDFNGALNIKVTASDGALEASDTFTLDISSVNDAPVLDNALSDQTSDEDAEVSFVLPADAFSDVDGDTLTLTASLSDDSALPAWLSFDADTRTFSGTPPQDFNGALDIKVIASDGALEASDTFTLDISSVNDAPVLDNALSDQTSDEDAEVSFVLPADAFSDVDGDALTLSATLADDSALPAWLSFDAVTRTFSGTPPQDFNGALDIKVTASDGELEASDIFTLDISSVNDAPILNNALSDQSSDEDTAVNFVLPADVFSDVDGDALTLTASLSDDSVLPAWLSFDADTRTFSGTPPQDFNGALDIKVIASDGELEASDTFTLDISSVNDTPVLDNALADQSSDEDTAVNFVLPADAFSDVDGDALTLSATLADDSALPAWLSFDADTRAFSGTPPQDFNDALNIKVTASDGELEASDTFTLDISSVNDAPVLDNVLSDQTSDEDTAVNFVLPADAFSDVDGDALTLSATLADDSALPSWLSFDADTRTFSGTPPQDFNGALDIKVIASDGELEASDTFTLDISSVNDAPVLDNALSDQSSDEDTAVSFVLPADAFSDADGDTLTLTASLSDDSALPAWLSFDADTRTFSGTPPQDFNGALNIKVTVSDGELEASDTFTLDISSVNDAPILNNALADQSSDEDTAVSFVLPADAFSDADGDTLTLTASLSDDSALPAWLSFDADTRTFAGTPPQDFNGALDIKVTVSDGELEASDTFTLDISSVNDAPVLDNALSDQTSDEDTAVSFVLPADAFSDVDGDALTLTAMLVDDSALPAWLSFDAVTRTFSGTPPQDFNGALDIKVVASDGALEASDTFTLDIASVNDAPIAQNDSGFSAVNTASLVINASDLLSNDSDVDSTNLSISAVTNSSSGGTVEINADGDIVYTAAEGFSGQDIFQYTITDGEQTSSAFVEVTVSDDASNPYDGWTIGTDGRDYIFGDLFDNNQIYGAGGNDILVGGLYADEIDGGTGRDRIFGLWGDDTLNGNEGNDKIFGGAGADTISGGAGSDKLWGGWGSDTFKFSAGSGRDRIMDFSTGNSWYSYFSGKDKIQIDIEGVDSFDDLSAFASEVNGNTIFDFGNGDELILSNTRLAALDKDAFTFY